MKEIGSTYSKNDPEADAHAETLAAVLAARQQLERIEARVLGIMDRCGVEPERVKSWARERGFTLSQNALNSVDW